MWSSAYEELLLINGSLGSICNFTGIRIEEKNSFAVTLPDIRESIPSSACFAALLGLLIQSQGVINAYLESKPRTVNYYGGQTMESGSVTGGRPFSDRGLNGTGQIIGHCDTGIDLYSCYFRDRDNRAVSLCYHQVMSS